ncbi:hypothetical protein tpqmel_0288 [Candidatus Gastranaerophilus sp. (ex Termes propinquus)]|nr:hypothetical protein tpqmel_0288 [Candidatus Gastranaerophilus sp. (ex Termes propinquus)]
MAHSLLMAHDFISRLPIYVHKNSPISEVVEKMDKYSVGKITVTDENFNISGSISRIEIIRYLGKNRIKADSESYKKLKVSDILKPQTSFITAYPSTDLKDMQRIMIASSSEYLPIAKDPWNKTLLGFVFLNHIVNIN